MDVSAPRLLILETSGRAGQAAVAVGAEMRGLRQLDEARRQGRDLAPAVAALLAEQGWRPHDLQGVIVSHGPGSYTGLRVGIISAKTLAYATGCALLAVDTLAAIAHQVPEEVVAVEVMADAQQDKIYLQSFARVPHGFRATTALTIRPFAAWLAERAADAWITGPGLRKWREQLPTEARVIAAERWEPQASGLLRLGLARFQAGERDDPWTLEPLYLRPSSAEEQWRRRTP